MSGGRGNLLRQAISLVLHYPTAARAVEAPEALAAVDKPGVSVLQELLEQAAAAAAPTTAMLLERWRDRAEYGRLAELASMEPLVADTAAAASELQMAVQKLLEEFGPGRRMNELLRKARRSGLEYARKGGIEQSAAQ